MSWDRIELNPPQREAVEYLGTPLLVIAGAGSGKTRVLTAKIAYLLDAVGHSPYSVMAVTFTNKAAGEMLGRVRGLVGSAADGVSAGTFHSFCARLLRRHADRLGYSPDYSIYDDADQKTLLRRILGDMNLPEKTFTPGMVRARISRAKSEMVGPGDADWFGDGWVDEGVVAAYRAYQEVLRRNNAMDFDDLLVNAVRLLEGADDLKERYQERYRYILVDEYQDTNRPQYRLIQLLAARHRGLCVVGDPDQSIYGWRGADIRNIMSFEQDWKDAKTVILDQNYRSTQTILSAASAVIANNGNRHSKDLWSELGDGDPVHELIFLNDEEEARGIARIVQAKHRQEKIPLSEIAILYRTNAQSRALERALRGAGIAYTIVGGVRFYERAEIKDALAYFRVLCNPRDRVSLERALGVPKRGIGRVTLDQLSTFLDGWEGDPLDGLLAASEGVGRASGALRTFAEMVRRYRDRISEPAVATLARDLLEEAGYLDMHRDEGTLEAETRLENLGELLSGMEEFADEHGEDSDLVRFLEEVSLLTDVDEWNDDGRSVTLMTLHAAKGLEFDLLFLTGVEEGLFPLARAAEDPDSLEEERRLCYVGMTRARRQLHLTRARRRRKWGSVMDALPSRFLGEIPPEFLERVDQFQLVSGSEPRDRYRVGGRGTSPAHDEMPDYENENQDPDGGFRPGQSVEHDVLGRGRVLEVTGQGEHTRLVVAFQQAGTKHLMARYARLRVVD